MTTLAQLPETRRAVLLRLKEQGPLTLAEVAQEIGVTREAARQQLLQLELAGWVEAVSDAAGRGRVGRPASRFQLSVEGEALFPKRYEGLALALVDAVSEAGPQVARELLAGIADRRVAEWEKKLAGAPREQRAKALQALYLEEDPFMELRPDGEDLLLIERNCPYLEVALERPAICSLSTNVIARVMDAPVVREERFQDGHRRCVFRIKLGEGRGPRGFRYEPAPPQKKD